MNIVADKSIPFISSFFGGIGELTLLDTREISRQGLDNADLVIVRTVTRVNRELLEGTPVRFVATASSGHDHVDMDYLKQNGIGFAHAPGCNARSVAEYVLSCLFVLAAQKQFTLQRKSIGIIGCGNVGTCLSSFVKELGMECLIFDPPRQERGDALSFSTLDEVQTADIISLHVPLIVHGTHPTSRLVNAGFLSKLRSDVILINTSRGDVVDEDALDSFMDSNPDSSVVLDVWQKEPDINIGLLRKTRLSTPHIAGYSLDAKFRGTRAIFNQVCDAFTPGYNEPGINCLPENEINLIRLDENYNDIEAIQLAVLASYDVRADSAALRQIQNVSDDKKGEYFSDLRNNYPSRREFTSMTISTVEVHAGMIPKMQRLGFKLV